MWCFAISLRKQSRNHPTGLNSRNHTFFKFPSANELVLTILYNLVGFHHASDMRIYLKGHEGFGQGPRPPRRCCGRHNWSSVEARPTVTSISISLSISICHLIIDLLPICDGKGFLLAEPIDPPSWGIELADYSTAVTSKDMSTRKWIVKNDIAHSVGKSTRKVKWAIRHESPGGEGIST